MSLPALGMYAASLRRRVNASAVCNQDLVQSVPPTPRSVTHSNMLLRPAAAAASAAATVAAETGRALMPMFETLANNLVRCRAQSSHNAKSALRHRRTYSVDVPRP